MSFHDELVARFRWVDGHADILSLLSDAKFLAAATEALAQPLAELKPTKIAAVEARGFVFGTGVALKLGCGFVPIRKAGSVHPGPKVEKETLPDWRGKTSLLRVQRAALDPGDRVALVDDWAETGNQARAAKELIEACGASYCGLSILIDELTDEARSALEPIAAVAMDGDVKRR